MRFATILIVLSLVVGCNKQISRDRDSLFDLSLGSSRAEVMQIMGHKPYKTEAKAAGKRSLEILYYITERKGKYSGLSERKHMTPILLEDGKVIGWGWKNFDDKTKRFEIEISR